ncbi:MAG TPA: response regulator transcription factor [Chitinophagaceae bacterium]|nr:response regulator transcription factor [Chitinophagaceae bacterium]
MLQILIADDHEIVRKGLKQILIDEFAFANIEEVSDGAALVEKAISGSWDIILSDMAMPGLTGLQALEQIKKHNARVPVLILSMYPADQYALRVIKAGASGYVTKDTAQEELVTAIRRILSGKKYIPSLIAEQIIEEIGDHKKQLHEILSDRELTVMKLLAEGRSISEIAQQLNLGVTTISTYRSRILEKMNLRTNADLTRYALEHELI